MASIPERSGLPPPPPPSRPPAPPPRRRRRRLWIVAAVLVVAAGGVAAAVLLGAAGPARAVAGPLSVGADVALAVHPSTGGCGTTFTFDATGSLTGTGDLRYRWEQSDGSRGADVVQHITADQGGFHFVETWRLQGPQSVSGSETLHLLQPVDRAVSRTFAYHCP